MFIGWRSPDTVVFVSAPGDVTGFAPVMARTLTNASGPWSPAVVATPRLVQTSSGGSVAPDGHAYLIPATLDPLGSGVWWLMDAETGQATQVGGDGATAWTSNESIALIKFDSQSNQPSFVNYDVATKKSTAVGSMPLQYINGVWLGR